MKFVEFIIPHILGVALMIFIVNTLGTFQGISDRIYFSGIGIIFYIIINFVFQIMRKVGKK